MTAGLVGSSGFAAIPTTALDLPLVQRLQRSPRFWVRVPIAMTLPARSADVTGAAVSSCGIVQPRRAGRRYAERRGSIAGRLVRPIEDGFNALREYVACYNAQRLIEKNGHRSPLDRHAKPIACPRPPSCHSHPHGSQP